jgi:exodeoxyribonuclease VII large subunit
MLIERDEVLSQVWVEGEISGFNVHQRTGHAYFSLRDSASTVRAVMFCSDASKLRFLPKDGMYVVAKCKISFYERDGMFQLYVYDLVPQGAGAVQHQLEKVKKTLAAEGLFDYKRKRPLPATPTIVGVIASASSAALKDIISVTQRRNPLVRLKLFSADVQGTEAVESLIKAIARVNAAEDIDVVIIARGGGSKEDLWCFNDEALVRAAAALRVPFVSAVGHETDFSLLDEAADVRAPTPSAAAEMVLPDIRERIHHVRAAYADIRECVYSHMTEQGQRLQQCGAALKSSQDQFLRERQRVLDHLSLTCSMLDPMNVLLRGYTRAVKEGTGVESIRDVAKQDQIDVIFRDGVASCRVEQIKGESPWKK